MFDEYTDTIEDYEDEDFDQYAKDTASTSVDIFFSQIRRYKVLTRREEETLGRAKAYWAQYQESKIANFPRTPEPTCTAEELYRSKQAFDKMLIHNQRLIVYVAKRYLSYFDSPELADLIQMGQAGLHRAVVKYNPSLGNKFATYAIHWIRQSIRQGLHHQHRVIRIPIHTAENIESVRKAETVLMQEYGFSSVSEVSNEMLAEYMNHPLDWVGKYRNVNTDVAPVSLSTFLTDDGDLELGDTIVDTRAQEEYDEMIIEEEREIIDAALAQLHEEDRRILILRCGLKGEDSRTLEDTALKMGSTREHVRLREEKAMKQLHEILSVSLEAYRD